MLASFGEHSASVLHDWPSGLPSQVLLKIASSHAEWFDPGESWLPRADRIGLDWAGSRTELSWDQVQGQLEPVGLFPERYRLSEASRPELLERLLA